MTLNQNAQGGEAEKALDNDIFWEKKEKAKDYTTLWKKAKKKKR